MISGTYVLNGLDRPGVRLDLHRRAASTLVVSGKSAFDITEERRVGVGVRRWRVLDDVRAVDGVAEAEGSVDSESTTLIDRDNKAIVFGGAPNLGFAIANGESPFNPLTLVHGQWSASEVVIDENVADEKDFAIGDTIGVQAEGPVERMRLGIVRFGSSNAIGGATLAGFDLPTAQRLFEKDGKLDEIAIAAEPGVSAEELAAAVEDVLPPNTQVRTAAAQAEEDAADTNEFITFLRGFLPPAGIALFVGSFVIANSLSITIAQRTREFATVRTLGGSRRQVLGSIVIEALVVGLGAPRSSGSFAGLLLAKGLFSLFDAVGFTLPNQGLLLETRTIVVALVGVLVTLFASRRPAIRAPRAADRGSARRRDAAGVAVRPFPHRRLALADGTRLPRSRTGSSAAGSRTTQILVWMGSGAPDLPRRRALLGEAPAAAAAGAFAGAAEAAQARDNARRNPPHRLHRRGADDRARSSRSSPRSPRGSRARSAARSTTSSPPTTRSRPRTTSPRSRPRPPMRRRRRRWRRSRARGPGGAGLRRDHQRDGGGRGGGQEF